MKRLVITHIMLTFFMFAPVHAASVTSAEITKDVLSAVMENPFGNFLNYKVEGSCAWLVSTPHGMRVKHTPKVREFLPDAVVTVFTAPKHDPWVYGRTVLDPLAKKAGDQFYSLGRNNLIEHSNYQGDGAGSDMQIYKEVNVVGDPALLVFYQLGLQFAQIKSVAKPYVPYYSSLADSRFWRSPMMDLLLHPDGLLPGSRVVGSLIDEWGSIYPRIGYLNQLGDFKAQAVLLLRALDIVTHPFEPRIYHYLESESCGKACRVWPVRENDYAHVRFQEIYPVLSSKAKKVFGINDLLSFKTYGQDQFMKGHGNYIWIMWRRYEGCVQAKGKFLGEIAW